MSGANDWVDTFDNDGPAIQQLNDRDHGYRRFDVTSDNRIKVGYFINVNHWMPDIADTSSFALQGGSMLSPDQSFHFENGTLVIEADGAAGSDGMGGADAFYEIDISPARAPTGIAVDHAYGYGQFGGVGGMGCRLERAQDGGHIVCAMYDASSRDSGGISVVGGPSGLPGRVWETQGVGTAATAASVQGGYPGWPIPGTNLHVSDVWRQCADNELDLHCRDRFRMEITKDSLHIFANGYLIYAIDGLFATNPNSGADNRIPDSWLTGVGVYYTSWITAMHHPTRWHWDRLAVNPHQANGAFAAPSSAPSFCFGMPHNTCPDPPDPTGAGTAGAPTSTAVPIGTTVSTSTPTRTATATTTTVATATATQTVTALPTSTASATPKKIATPTGTPAAGGGGKKPVSLAVNFDNLPSVGRALSGQYPSGVIDWGSKVWYLSGPYDKFRTNSISFNGAGPTSGTFTFLKPSLLTALDADNGGQNSTTVTLSCPGQTDKVATIAPGQSTTISTRWTAKCVSVTIRSTNGWDTNFDNLLITTFTAV